MGYHFLLQGIFQAQESNPHLCVSCISRWVLYHWATREAPWSLYLHTNYGLNLRKKKKKTNLVGPCLLPQICENLFYRRKNTSKPPASERPGLSLSFYTVLYYVYGLFAQAQQGEERVMPLTAQEPVGTQHPRFLNTSPHLLLMVQEVPRK